MYLYFNAWAWSSVIGAFYTKHLYCGWNAVRTWQNNMSKINDRKTEGSQESNKGSPAKHVFEIYLNNTIVLLLNDYTKDFDNYLEAN